MKLGFLNAVEPHYNEATGKTDPEAFRELFASIDVTAEMPDYAVTEGEFPTSIDECDAYLVTGSPNSVYDDAPWITALKRFVADAYDAGKPMVGICFGHQLIADVLGGTVQDADHGWLLGRYEFDVVGTRPWMGSQQENYALYFVNHDQVVELPPGAERLAGSDVCPNVMYTIGNQVLCIQPHPEHERRSVEIFTEGLKPELSAETYQYARTSLAGGEPDAKLFARWIWDFLMTSRTVSSGTTPMEAE